MKPANKFMAQNHNLKTLEHEDPAVDRFMEELKEISVEGTYYLLLLTGPYIKGKKKFLEKLSSVFGRNVTHIDLRDIVSLDVSETKKNTDRLFDSLTVDDHPLFFSNGDRLCGTYTGFTYSKTRYPTPQERYFLKKLNRIGKLIILDIQDEDNVDKTLERRSHSGIRFDRPSSFLKRLTWKLGDLDFHGHTFTSKRPVKEIALS